MSTVPVTGGNKEETDVSKKRRRKLPGYIHPNKAEIKKFDFFTGQQAYTGGYRIHNSKEFIPIHDADNLASDQVSAWTLVKMADPDQGTTSYERVGNKYFLKYIKFKGHISICVNIPFTVRYKLLLIKSDRTYSSTSEFFGNNYSNYEIFQAAASDEWYATESYCRHNFYKTYKWPTGMAECRTSVMVVSSGTLTPSDYVPRPTKSSTLNAESPAYSYTLPDVLRFGSGTPSADLQLDQLAYLPLNVSVQVNDNVTVGLTHFYLMLLTDHGIGCRYPVYSGGAQFLYRASKLASSTYARFNFFGCCYFTDP